MAGKLAKLAALADMIKEAELGKLRDLEAKRQSTIKQTSDLQISRRKAIADASADAAHISGSVNNWERWAESKTRELSVKTAQAAAEAEAQKLRARRAFGRAAALERLVAEKTKR